LCACWTEATWRATTALPLDLGRQAVKALRAAIGSGQKQVAHGAGDAAVSIIERMQRHKPEMGHELTENLKKNITVDWAQRESVRATLRLMVKRILRKYKYPPDQQEAAVELVLEQVERLGEGWG